MSRKYKVLCGVPSGNCSGGHLSTDQRMNTNKCHSSRDEAFRCMARHLVRDLGFTRVGPRAFQNPNNGPIRILTKKIRFGAMMVTGKEGTRYMPDKKAQGNRGTIS